MFLDCLLRSMYYVTSMSSVAILEKLSDNDVNATISRSSESAGGPKIEDEKFVVGLTLLLALIFLGVAVSVLLCIATQREPTLWMTVFEGLMPKNSATSRQFAKFPRRVRFQLPENHSNRGSSKTMTHTLLSLQNYDEERQEPDYEEGMITLCQ